MLNRLQSPPNLRQLTNRTSTPAEKAEASSPSSLREAGWRKLAKGAMAAGAVYSALNSSAAAQEVVQEQSQAELQCRVIVLDSFLAGTRSHGAKVSLAAKQMGHNEETIDIDLKGGRVRRRTNQEFKRFNRILRRRTSSKEQLARTLEARVELKLSSEYDVLSAGLEYATARGFVNSTANVSQGYSEYSLANTLFAEASQTWSKKNSSSSGFDRSLTAGYARLFSLNYDKLVSSDDSVNLAERNKLRQSIVDRVHELAGNNERVAVARQRWTKAVGEFESNRNSVILAAGNSGIVAANLGQSLIVPQGFFDNIFDDEQVTSVGATVTVPPEESDNPGEYIANYSTPSDGIDIYANGTLPYGSEVFYGTSFAAPRVATLASEAHCSNPHLSSDEVEAYVIAGLTK